MSDEASQDLSTGRKPAVAVIGSGREDEPAVSNARHLGLMIAQKGWVLISGGRNAGVMRAANEGAKDAGGLTIGILPDRRAKVAPAVNVAIITDMGEARNNIIVLSADVVVACGVDDPGTLSEVALALKAEKPVVLLGSAPGTAELFRRMGCSPAAAAESAEEAVAAIEVILSGGGCDVEIRDR